VAEFKPALAYVLKNEGGYANNPKDPGGATNYGISLRFLKTLGHEYGDIDKDGDIDDYDIRLITPDNSSKIYKTFWWDKYRYGSVKNQITATKILDFAVNAGSFRAHKIIQMAVNDVAKRNALVIDGILGAHTLGALNRYNSGCILFSFCWRQVEFYKGLVAKNPKLWIFLQGWEKRAWRKPK
jgi:lysozyme family protein